MIDGKAPIYSVNNAVSCSAYNQGCDGGYPILVFAHGKDFGFVSNSCSGDSDSDSYTCDAKCLGQPEHVQTIEKYNYVGGYYGGCNEEHMVKALQYGPMPVAFEVRATNCSFCQSSPLLLITNVLFLHYFFERYNTQCSCFPFI